MNTFNDALFNDNVYFDIDDKGNTKLVWDNVKINFTNNILNVGSFADETTNK